MEEARSVAAPVVRVQEVVLALGPLVALAAASATGSIGVPAVNQASGLALGKARGLV